MARPDFLCIGAQKAGTSWLFENLRTHPEIWSPPVKELHFFDHMFVEKNRKWTQGHIRRGAKQAIRWHIRNAKGFDPDWIRYLCNLVDQDPFTPAWYEMVFDRAPEGRKSIDITPEYCTLPQEGVDYVERFLPDAGFIYVIRDPVERALSQLRMNLERRDIKRQSEEAWMASCAEPDIANRGDYKTYVPRWIDAFGRDRILFLPFGRIAAAPLEALAEVERFMGVSPKTDYKHLEKQVHASKPLRIPDYVRRHFEQALAPQRSFLTGFFGEEFVAQT